MTKLDEYKVASEIKVNNLELAYKEALSYYGTISSVIKGYKELQIRNSNVTTIDELIKLIKELDEKIETLLGAN